MPGWRRPRNFLASFPIRILDIAYNDLILTDREWAVGAYGNAERRTVLRFAGAHRDEMISGSWGQPAPPLLKTEERRPARTAGEGASELRACVGKNGCTVSCRTPTPRSL